MKKIFIQFPVLLLILLNSFIFSYSQDLKFRPFGADKGLSDNYVYSIQQDNNGFLWLGTGEGLCRFDGMNFITKFPGDSIDGSIVDKSFKDSRGRVWFGMRDGSIAVLNNNNITALVPDSTHKGNIIGFAENSKGDVIAGTQNRGLILIKEGFSLSYIDSDENDRNLSSIYITAGDKLLAGTFEGLYLFNFSPDFEFVSLMGKFEDIPSSKILTVVKKEGSEKYWIGIEDEGLYLLGYKGNDINSHTSGKIGSNFGLQYSKVLKVLEDHERNLWIGTNGEGVFKLISSGTDSSFTHVIRYTEQNGMPSNYISDIFRDFEGNFWFSTIGKGITVLKEQAFTFYNFESDRFNDNILSIAHDGDTYYLGGEGGLLVTSLSYERREILLDTRNGLPADKITALFNDGSGYLWIGTSTSGVYRMKIGTRNAYLFHHSSNSLENNVNAITGNSKNIWIATYGGVISISRKDLSVKILTTRERLPHNKIRSVFVDSKDNVWIATRARGLYNITEGLGLTIDAKDELEFVSITEDKEGHLWAATDGDGVFEFARDSLIHFNTQHGMRSNYCYSIACDENGNIWVGHRLGMSKIEKKSSKVLSYGLEQGMSADCNPNAIISGIQEHLIFGTSKGLIEYDAEKDILSSFSPKVNITGLKISDQDHAFSEEINLPYNFYRIRIDFIGISMKNPESIRYQYKLEGYDENWSEPSGIPFSIFRLSEGRYTFQLRACDALDNCTETSLLQINIRLPFWKTWWFILLVISLLIFTVYLIIKVRERNHKIFQEFLQKSLDERTREVREQAEVIESKNRDITDSINYAQRIQASVLPSIQRLQHSFPGSFVFYQPRDIVSGDFYWYDRVDDNRFIIVCADSTGHGVPGAFMSMIGTTLIKDICSRKGVRSPSEILVTLDREIKDALNQNAEGERANDGMDIIVAEFDLSAKYLRIASAMRPIILYIDGQQIYVKGSSSSVGGRYEYSSSDKEFINESFQLSSGDLIYMFSDGYPDQFGGPLGKKFKMVRLKNLIRDIHDKPMEEQYNYVKNNFNLWKEDLEQVDDVLFMGIKV